MSYPVSGIVREYIAPDYISDHPIIPHGISVALNAPAVFRFTGPSNPKRHMEAAKALGADTRGINESEGGELLPRPAGPDKLADLFKDAMQYW